MSDRKLECFNSKCKWNDSNGSCNMANEGEKCYLSTEEEAVFKKHFGDGYGIEIVNTAFDTAMRNRAMTMHD